MAVETESPATKESPATPPAPSSRWQKYVTPVFVVLLALAVLVTLIRNWNSWEGGHLEQVTDDAYVRGDLTPLSTKVAGIVQSVAVSDYQQVHKGDLIVELEDNDYQAQVSQANAAVEAARAAIENNLRQRQLKTPALIGLAGIDQAKAQIAQRRPARTLLKLNGYVLARRESGRRTSIKFTQQLSRNLKLQLLMNSASPLSSPAATPTCPRPEPGCIAMSWLLKQSGVKRSFSSLRRCNLPRIFTPKKQVW